MPPKEPENVVRQRDPMNGAELRHVLPQLEKELACLKQDLRHRDEAIVQLIGTFNRLYAHYQELSESRAIELPEGIKRGLIEANTILEIIGEEIPMNQWMGKQLVEARREAERIVAEAKFRSSMLYRSENIPPEAVLVDTPQIENPFDKLEKVAQQTELRYEKLKGQVARE